MSDDRAIAFVSGLADQFREHALAIIGTEPIVVRGAAWTEHGVELDYVVETGQMLPNRVSRDHVLELLARTYRVRSSRVLWGEWLLPEIPGNFQDLLEQRFPVYRNSGLELGPGWYDLLWATGEWLHEVDPERDVFMQTKEKLGGLRLYGPLTDAGEPIVEAAELLSMHICDICGKQGERSTRKGWVLTRCAEHVHA